jgi:hypothetical protein
MRMLCMLCTRVGVGVVAAILASAPAHAAVISVAAGANLQEAIDRARPGDTLMLAPGAMYSGNFTLSNKGTSTAFITIRSAVADGLLPPDGVRVTPAHASKLPVLQSPNAMSVVTVLPGAHHWRLQYLELRANSRGFGDIVTLGYGDKRQTQLSQAPYALILDHLYVHGDPRIGQKRGIAVHSGYTWITNCYISDIKAVGIDTQAIMGYNGPGPWTIVNNYLEAAGENFMVGGASPKIPNLIPADIQFRRNHLFKPLSWRKPIVATPQDVVANGGSGGALPAGAYFYRVVAAMKTAQDVWAYSARAPEVSATVGAGGRVTLAWTPVPHAASYRIFRGRSTGQDDVYFDTPVPSFTDSGAGAGTAASKSAHMSTLWTVKNLFELKIGLRVIVQENVMENVWQQAQTGYAVLFTPRNQDKTSPWVYVRDVRFISNVIRHMGAGITLEGYDTNAKTEQTRGIVIRDNLFTDISSGRWGGPGRFIQIGNEPRDLTIDHNTVVQNGHVVFVYGGTRGAEMPVRGVSITSNLFQKGSWGIAGNGLAEGNDTIATYFPESLILRNTIAGAQASRYPPQNLFPELSEWKAQFLSLLTSDAF